MKAEGKRGVEKDRVDRGSAVVKDGGTTAKVAAKGQFVSDPSWRRRWGEE